MMALDLLQRRRKLNAIAVRKHRYGIDGPSFAKKVSDQKGLCAICCVKLATYIDHCHATGKLRDVLCQKCNTGLGMFLDSSDFLRAAADYLDRHNNLS